MPRLSIFTPVGLLRMTAADAEARVIFNAKVSALGANRLRPAYATVDPNTRLEAKLYAESIMEAAVRMLLRRGGDADDPKRIHPELVPLREMEWGLVPEAGDTMALRKGHLQAAYQLPGGGDRYSIENALKALLGSGFIYYRTMKPSERVSYPSAISDSPINLQAPTVKRVLIRLGSLGVSLPGPSAQKVYYVPFDPLSPPPGQQLLQKNDVLVLEPEISARTETVTVLDSGTDGGGSWFSAVVENAHEPAAVGTTAPFPFWVTNQRFALIIVTAAVAADTKAIRRIHLIMQRLARGVSGWAIAAATGPGQAGPFQISISPLGTTTLGTVTFP